MPRFVIIGLGNVGEKYDTTRHNIGFEVVDRLAAEHGLKFIPGAGDYYSAVGAFTSRDKDSSRLSSAPKVGWWQKLFGGAPLPNAAQRDSGQTHTSAITLIKPTTLMNLSGRAVRQAMVRFALTPAQMVVVCDDMNLPLGAVRLRKSGSDGGHNGLKSITYELDSEDYPRLRLGIGPRPSGDRLRDYALSPFDSNELAVKDRMVAQAVTALEALLEADRSDALEFVASKCNTTGLDPAPGSGAAI